MNRFHTKACLHYFLVIAALLQEIDAWRPFDEVFFGDFALCASNSVKRLKS